MLKICVLEDEAAQMERMKAYLQKFQSEHADFEYVLDAYKNAFDLLEHTTNGMLTFFFSTFVCRT